VFAEVHSFSINGASQGAVVSVSQQINPTIFSPSSNFIINASMQYVGGSGTQVSMTASLAPAYNDTQIIGFQYLNATTNSVNGNLSITAPNTPGNYVVVLRTLAFGDIDIYNFPITVVSIPTVTMTATPSNIAYGAMASISWSSTNAVSCVSSGGGGTGPTGSFYTPNLFQNTTYSVTCTNPAGNDSSSIMVIVGSAPGPFVSISANPMSVPINGTSSISWTSSGVDWCTGGGNGMIIDTLVSPTNGVSSNPIDSDKTFSIYCQKDPVVIPPSCTGNYSVVTPMCTGQILGGNTCGVDEGEDCGQFDPNLTTAPNGCVIANDSWCHHACRVTTSTVTNSCSGLSQTQCNAKPTCSWNPGSTGTIVSVEDTVTVGNTDVSLSFTPSSVKDLVARGVLPTLGETNLNIQVNSLPAGESCILKNNKDGSVIIADPNPFYNGIIISRPYSQLGSENNFYLDCTNPANNTSFVNVKGQSGTLPASASCEIMKGASSCMGVPINWTTINPNPLSTTDILHGTNILVSLTGTGGTAFVDIPGSVIPTGSTTGQTQLTSRNKVDGENNGPSVVNTLDTMTMNVSCEPGSVWTGSMCGNKDLIASLPPESTVRTSTNVKFTSTITNQGNLSTGVSFANIFKVASEENGGGTITTITSTPNPMGILTGGGSALATSATYNTGPVVKKISVQACADSADAVTPEASNSNNCSGWKNIDIISDNFRDLIASAPSPSSAIIGTAVNFTSNIVNQGTIGTLWGFYNKFQIATEANGGGTITIINSTAPNPMGALGGGTSSLATSVPYTFTGEPRAVSVRACADTTNLVPNEKDENNNCSGWVNVILYPAPGPNLTAFATTATNTVTLNTQVAFNATIKNTGSLATPAFTMFPNFIQITSEDPGGSNPVVYNKNFFRKILKDIFPIEKVFALGSPLHVDLQPVLMGPLSPGGEDQTTSSSYTFTSAGVYYVRACADKYNSNTDTTNDVVNETNESNNCGDWTSINVIARPDLIASSPTPVNLEVGSNTFYSTITNQGNANTNYQGSNTFTNVFQVATGFDANDQPIGLNSYYVPGMASIAVGGTAISSVSISFNSTGTYYMRACADKSLNGAGSINESNEDNNCSTGIRWTAITIGSSPDLVASTPPENNATVGVPINFTSMITNQGASGTGNTFYNSFQIATGINGGGTISDINSTPSPMPILAAGGHAMTTSNSYTFSSSGTKSVRACADKNTSRVGRITESNEDNNCSGWRNIIIPPVPVPVITLTANPIRGDVNVVNPTLSWTTTNNPTSCTASGDWSGSKAVAGGNQSMGVLNTVKTYSYSLVCANSSGDSNVATATVVVSPVVMTGTLTGSSCTIALGANSCNTTLSWSIDNTEAIPSAITASGMADISLSTPTIGSDYSGTKIATVPYSSRTFFLYNNNKSLVPTAESPSGSGVVITASCGTNVWDGTKCVVGTPVNGLCSNPNAHYICGIGNSINRGEDPDSWYWDCEGTGGGANDSCKELKGNVIIDYFTATPTNVLKGKSSVLSWSAPSATSCTGTNFNTGNSNTGSDIVAPILTTVYTLTCTDGGSSNPTSEATIQVIVPVIIEN
jgi:hypothetical protein